MTDTPAPQIRHITWHHPLRWLALGWRDIVRGRWLSLAHGVALAGLGLAVMYVAHNRFWLLVGAASGFLFVAPVLATSLYCMSRNIERGGRPGLKLVWDTWMSWRRHGSARDGKDWRLVQFGLLLALAGTGWVLTSAALITLLSPVSIEKPLDFLRYIVLGHDNWLFEIWLALGGLMAAPMFASSAVAIPMLLDRRVSVLRAVVTSWDAVMANPGPMAWWALLIMGLTMAGFFTVMLGLIIVMPLLGHASWHAYRDLVDASALPERTAPRAEGGA